MFGASEPGINWDKVVDNGMAVLIDFRNVRGQQNIRFRMLWAFTNLLEYILRRGPTRSKPLSLIVDELVYLLSLNSLEYDLLSADMDELINQVARNHMIWLTLAHQEMYQVSENLQKTLLTMGTQIFGRTTDLEAALSLAKRFYRYDPYLVKKEVPVWMGAPLGAYKIDFTTEEFTADEQQLLRSYQFVDLKTYHFLAATTRSEGTTSAQLQPINLEKVDEGRYVDENEVEVIRRYLMKRSGRPVSEVSEEIAKRDQLRPPPSPKQGGVRRSVRIDN
jgi:hypothetical protein